jgi:hypothetical protein
MGLNSNTLILVPIFVFALESVAATVITIQISGNFATQYFPISNQTLPPAPQYSNSFLGSLSTFAGAFQYAFQLIALMLSLLAQVITVLSNNIMLNPVLLFINAFMLLLLTLGIIGKLPFQSGD